MTPKDEEGTPPPSGNGEEPRIHVDLPSAAEVMGAADDWKALRAEAERGLATGPPVASLFHDRVADAHWDYLASIGQRAKAKAVDLGIDVDRVLRIGDEAFTWDFGIESHLVIEARYQAAAIQMTSQGLFLPAWYTPIPVGAAGFAMPGWLLKLLSLLGVEPEDLEVFGEAFTEEIGEDLLEELKDLFSDAAEDAADGRFRDAEEKLSRAVRKLGRVLERLAENLDDFINKLFRKWLDRIGYERAKRKVAKIGAKLASRFVPGVGWALFLLELLWLLLRNIGVAYF